ncbi:MAG: hypothetical protein ACFFB3_07780 [Candidatus Hodarchaeota archaeon]
MIKKPTIDDMDNLDELIEGYLQFMQERYGQPAVPLKDQLQTVISQNTRVVFAVYDQDGKAVGMTVGDSASRWITLFYIQNMLNSSGNSETFIYEKELFEAVFTHLKENSPTISIMRDLSEALGKQIVHSIKHFIEIEPEIPRIDLDVTLDNIPAATLYPSLGFQEQRRCFLSVWNREN